MKTNNEKGSLALEQVLFIAAIVAMSVGVYSFYEELSGYFSGIDIPQAADLTPPNFSTTNS